MICSSCRRTLFSRFRSLNLSANTNTSIPATSLRYASSTTPSQSPAAPIPTASFSLDKSSSTTTSDISSPPSQSLSKPAKPSAKDGKGAVKPRSSVAGGKELRGLGYTKTKPRVQAMEDDEYPEWLWGLLDETRPGAVGEKVDFAAMTKKQRARHDKQQDRLLKDLPAQIPVHEQSKDLTGPGDNAITSLQRRQEITKSARAARRKGIRESNFLKSM